MTNEQLAEAIQDNDKDLIPVLYNRVKFIMYKQVGEQYSRFAERFNACGVELADLRSECYPAFLKAVDGYKPADEYKFTTYLKYHVKNVLSSALGIHNTKRLNNKPLDNCQRLEMPLNTEDGNLTLGDTLIDETSEQAFENVIDGIQDEQTREVIHNALERLDEDLRNVIVLYYFEDMTQEQIGRLLGVSGERVRQIRYKALRKLRCMPDVRMLREEQRIESRLHFRSWDNTRGFYEAQEKIAEILKRGDYLSYGKRQAIIYDCRIKQKLEDNAKYNALSELEKVFTEIECKQLYGYKNFAEIQDT